MGKTEYKIKSIRIDSENICYGPMPKPDDEVFQHLTINSKGRVWLTRYTFGNGFSDYLLKSKEYYRLSDEATKLLFDALEDYFFDDNSEIYEVTDVGSWSAMIILENEEPIAWHGSLISDEGKLHNISEMIRSELKDNSIYVFDVVTD